MKKPLLAAVLGGLLAMAGSAQVFPVNVTTLYSQHLPDAAALAAGGFVAVWQDDGSPAGIRGRLFQASGLPAGGEIEIVLDQAVDRPRVAATPDGGFVVVWTALGANIRLRRFDAAAHPLGEAVQVASLASNPDVAVDGAGNILVVYATRDSVFLRGFLPDGLPDGNATPVTPQPTSFPTDTRIAANPAGSLLVSWGSPSLSLLSVRRFDAATGAWGPVVILNPGPGHKYVFGAVPVLYPEGDGALVYSRDLDVVRTRLNSVAQAVDTEAIGERLLDFEVPDVAVDASGNALVVWSRTWVPGDLFTGASAIRARLFDRSWHPLGAGLTVRPTPDLYDGEPAAAALGGGGFAVLWTNGEVIPTDYIPEPLPPRNGEDGSQLGVFGRIISPPVCVAGGEVLCLGHDGRFEARATWKTPNGQTGTARALPLTADTGALWFFGPSNLEIMLKVLDAHTVNGYFWVFYGSLSDVEYTIKVRDTWTGQENTYKNEQHQLASKADVQAFAYLEPTGIVKALPAADPPPLTSGLALVHDRFLVEVAFTDPRTNTVGQGQAVDLTGDTGAFWFFDPANLELMIKILDGRASNGHFWVFFGGLSDVDYTVTVTDSLTGAFRTYHNDRHTLASRADVNAF
ncbi:MAG: hypothetical protein ACJ75H_22005 [Thermoanaerobaculia bacterium]